MGKNWNEWDDVVESQAQDQRAACMLLLGDGNWHTTIEILRACGSTAGTAGVTARLRDLRKAKFGGHNIQSRRSRVQHLYGVDPSGYAIWEYRLVPGAAPTRHDKLTQLKASLLDAQIEIANLRGQLAEAHVKIAVLEGR